MDWNGGSQAVSCHHLHISNILKHCRVQMDSKTLLIDSCFKFQLHSCLSNVTVLNLDWTVGTILRDNSTMFERDSTHQTDCLPRVSNGHGWAQNVVLCYYHYNHDNVIFIFDHMKRLDEESWTVWWMNRINLIDLKYKTRWIWIGCVSTSCIHCSRVFVVLCVSW